MKVKEESNKMSINGILDVYDKGFKIALKFNSNAYLGIPDFLIGKDFDILDNIKIETKEGFFMESEYLLVKKDTLVYIDSVFYDEEEEELKGVLYPYSGGREGMKFIMDIKSYDMEDSNIADKVYLLYD